MKIRIVKIGNSQGIRIPKPLLEQTGLGEEVDLEVQRDRLVIKPLRLPRFGWAVEFQEMAAQEDDLLLDAEPLVSTRFDETEWEWR